MYIPTFNRAEVLRERALKSVLNQTYKNFECLIIDDGSTDTTNSVALETKDLRIHYYKIERKKDRGYPPTLENNWKVGSVIPSNYALNVARGQYIARLDDDDVWLPSYLEKMLKFAQKGKFEFITCQNHEIRKGEQSIYKGVSINEYFKLQEKQDGLIGSHSTYFYREYLRFMKYDINCWKKEWNTVMDTDLGERMVKLGVKMGFLQEPLMVIAPRPNETEIGLKAVLNR